MRALSRASARLAHAPAAPAAAPRRASGAVARAAALPRRVASLAPAAPRRAVTASRHRAAAAAADADAPSTSGRAADEEPPSSSSPEGETYLEYLQREFTVPGLVAFGAGPGGLPAAVLTHPDGARAELLLHGAALTSWRRADGAEALALRGDNAFSGAFDAPVRGGLGLAWPQVGAGALPPDGLLARLHWSVVAAGGGETELDVDGSDEDDDGAEGGRLRASSDAEEEAIYDGVDEEAEEELGPDGAPLGADPRPWVTLYATSTDETRALWPHEFEAAYTVRLERAPRAPEDARAAAAEAERWRATALLGSQVAAFAAADAPAPAPAPAAPAAPVLAAPAAPAAPAKSTTRSRFGPTQAEAAAADAAFAAAAAAPPPRPPAALRCSLAVANAGAAELRFAAALTPAWATADLAAAPRFVKVLGLGGKDALDYADDPMRPRHAVEEGDFLFFDAASGRDVDTLYPGAGEGGQVLFCPGTRHHVDLRCAEGFTDVRVTHAAGSAPGAARRAVGVGPARAAVPVRLPPGGEWRAEALFVYVNDYWPLPPFEAGGGEGGGTVPPPPRADAVASLRRGLARGAETIAELRERC
jgi:hypothetical protein